ncbi:MAG: replication-associated recombination protein A, partial [Roseiflexaceae bacterium]
PEGDLALANLVVYLAQAPKSNSVEVAYMKAKVDVAETRNDPVPLHLRNAPTALMKGLGYNRGYQYAHDAPDARVDQVHFPENLRGRRYYQPTDRGYEVRIAERLAWREDLESVKPLPVPEPIAPQARSKTPTSADGMIDPQATAGEEPQIPVEQDDPPVRPTKRARGAARG